MSGIPGSGKSTWVKQKIAEKGGFWASRDAVRFSMVREDEPYFERETEVFNAWIAQICDALCNPLVEDIYVDATHLNDRSREKTLSRLPKENINKITNVVFMVPIEVCLERNRQRTGRAVVPDEVIQNMAKSFRLPKKYSVMIIDKDGEVKANG
jgi:predicted kinase